MKSYSDILKVEGGALEELKGWIDPLMRASQFVHFFNNEIDKLPLDLLTDVHKDTRLSNHCALDHIIIIDKVPRDEEKYPKQWLMRQIIETLRKHHARIPNP